jgi:outer membrane biosynthesis protein TonB
VAPKPEAKPAETKHAAKPTLKPSVSDNSATATAAAPSPAPKDTQVAGSAPIVQPNSFDSRFGAVK